MSLDRAVILARGIGSRMREQGQATLTADQAAAADAGAKAMMPIAANRPFLDYVLSGLADAGYSRVCLVIGPDHQAVRDHYGGRRRPSRLTVDFAVQPEPRGTADAVLAAESWTGNDPFLVINGDNYYPVSALKQLHALDGPGTVLFRPRMLLAHSNIPEERIRAFAICTLDADGHLATIVEKPTDDQLAATPDPLVSMNCWAMSPRIHEGCRAIGPSARGELELADAIMWVIRERGERFRVFVSDEGVLDLSRRGDVAPVARALAGVAVNL
ncbi:MAG TPA: nucleotidyltransferase family protein [Vicinamibacterales bacterium]